MQPDRKQGDSVVVPQDDLTTRMRGFVASLRNQEQHHSSPVDAFDDLLGECRAIANSPRRQPATDPPLG